MKSNADQKLIKDKILEIADELMRRAYNSTDDLSLMDGKAGIAIFFQYLYQLEKDEIFYNHSVQLLTEIIDKIALSGCKTHTFCSGLAGIGWTLEHMARLNYIEADTNKILSDVDLVLEKRMMHDISEGNYDFLHGAIGIGMYFLNRKKKAKRATINLINQLYLKGEEEGDSIKWGSIIDYENKKIGYNLSLSHGISSIVAFLSKAIRSGIDDTKTYKLLKGGINYILSQQNKSDTSFSYFPAIQQEKSENLKSSRLAWCYGDLGIAMALYHAGITLSDEELLSFALKVLYTSTKRKTLQSGMVVDAGFCHGTAGITHIYNRMYLNTGNPIFLTSMNHWQTKTLDLAIFNDGLAGYKTYHPEKYGGWSNNVSLLTGIAGIGLSSISAISEVQPFWDECLLLS